MNTYFERASRAYRKSNGTELPSESLSGVYIADDGKDEYAADTQCFYILQNARGILAVYKFKMDRRPWNDSYGLGEMRRVKKLPVSLTLLRDETPGAAEIREIETRLAELKQARAKASAAQQIWRSAYGARHPHRELNRAGRRYIDKLEHAHGAYSAAINRDAA
jgi:hypothetical protein